MLVLISIAPIKAPLGNGWPPVESCCTQVTLQRGSSTSQNSHPRPNCCHRVSCKEVRGLFANDDVTLMTLSWHIRSRVVFFNVPGGTMTFGMGYPFSTFISEGPIHMVESGFQWETRVVHEHSNSRSFVVNSRFTILLLHTSQVTKLNVRNRYVSELK